MLPHERTFGNVAAEHHGALFLAALAGAALSAVLLITRDRGILLYGPALLAFMVAGGLLAYALGVKAMDWWGTHRPWYAMIFNARAIEDRDYRHRLRVYVGSIGALLTIVGWIGIVAMSTLQ